MTDFAHLRHKPPTLLAEPRPLVIACAPLRSNINLSRIVRAAGCSGIGKVIACGAAKVISKIARDGADQVEVEIHRTLPPVLRELRQQGYKIVALEQTTNSKSLYDFQFDRRTVLVAGNERSGLTEEELKYVDQAVEIPVYGLPYSHNVSTATAIAIYEYCRQFPNG
jgi:tRNA G18 (ribose-2'-O)-methylase SpoU